MPQPRPLGKPTSKRTFRAPRPMAFCRCSECSVYQYVNTQACEVTTGSMITLDQFKEHQKREIAKQAALQRLEVPDKVSSITGTHQPFPTAKNESSSTEANDTTATHQPTTKNDSSSAGLLRKTKKHEVQDSFYSLLCSFRSRLQACPVATFFQERSILFSNPPTKVSSKVPGYLNLEIGAPQNQDIIIHEQWLRDGLRRIQFQLNSLASKYQTSSHERLLAAMVVRNIRMALDQLENLKAEDWDRQYKLVRECNAPVIDTCKD